VAMQAASGKPGEHLSTFGGNPISCAAASANIDVMLEEDLPAQAAAKGERFLAGLHDLAGKHDLIGEVRGIGLMLGMELVTDRKTKAPAKAEAAAIRKLCRENGVLVGVGGQLANVVRIQPPLVISDEQLDRTLDILDAALTLVQKG
jgi:4-aminobutyrate aminotransferase / (S)-3-amino-2-methylpropionate transaminase / 5-aminovalerate transaminase